MFNIGRKDEHGRQRRIEHQGRHLRASRTGGIALRAQTKAAGVNLTASTSQGVRFSTAVGPGTQVALQNGRFVLRGRYGAGPLRLNWSKSGLSLSAKNRLAAIPAWGRETARGLRNALIRRRIQREGGRLSELPTDEEGLKTALALVYEGWGRGRAAGVFAEVRGLDEAGHAIAAGMDATFNGLPADERTLDAATAHVAEGLRRRLPPEALPEVILAMDERALEEGPRTRRQARMLEVIADFAGLRLVGGEAEKPEPQGQEPGPQAAEPEDRGQPEPAPPAPETGAPDINTADAETLATLPGIGPSRARDIIAHRPFNDLEGLQAVSGIGPATVARLREAGVRCE